MATENFSTSAPSLTASCVHPEQLLTAFKNQGYSGQSGQQAGYGQYNPYEQQQQQDNRYENYGNQGAGYGGNTQPYSTRPEPQQTNSSYYGEQEAGAVGSHGTL